MKDISKDSQGKIAWGRIATIVAALIAGITGGYFGQTWIHGNERAINVIVTSFSILAGFLVAIMTIMGDPAIFAGRSWRAHELSRGTVKNRLWRQQWLFVLYLATLSLIFAESLASHIVATVWLERIYLGMAIAAFVVSFRLPFTLMRIQMERHEEAIQSRRRGGNSSKDN
jgi:hypothetical protein